MDRNKPYEAFNIFDRDWGLATAGTLADFDGCTMPCGVLRDRLGFNG